MVFGAETTLNYTNIFEKSQILTRNAFVSYYNLFGIPLDKTRLL